VQLGIGEQFESPGVTPQLPMTGGSEAFLETMGQVFLGAVAVDTVVGGALVGGPGALQAGRALARDPQLFVNATEFNFNFQAGFSRGRRFQLPGQPVGRSPGAFLGRGLGFALGAGGRVLRILDDLPGP